jgi:hypothetical protein
MDSGIEKQRRNIGVKSKMKKRKQTQRGSNGSWHGVMAKAASSAYGISGEKKKKTRRQQSVMPAEEAK